MGLCQLNVRSLTNQDLTRHLLKNKKCDLYTKMIYVCTGYLSLTPCHLPQTQIFPSHLGFNRFSKFRTKQKSISSSWSSKWESSKSVSCLLIGQLVNNTEIWWKLWRSNEQNASHNLWDFFFSRVWSVRYNHSHDQLVLTASSDSRLILSNMVSISSEPFGHLVDEEELSEGEENHQEDK